MLRMMPTVIAYGMRRRDVADIIRSAFASRLQVFRGCEQEERDAPAEAISPAEGFQFRAIEKHRAAAVAAKPILSMECAFAQPA